MDKICFLYAGQGSQKVGMGNDLYEFFPVYKNVIDSIRLDFDFKSLMSSGTEEEIANTGFTQPCMAAFAAGVTRVLEEEGIRPDGAIGLSLGEYGALYAAGVWDTETYVKIAAFRGRVMEEAARGKATVMSAILGLAADVVEGACREAGSVGFVELTNYNCSKQYVICGEKAAVEAAEEKLKEAGAKKCIRLRVTAPFHTKLLKEAGDKLEEFFESISFGQPEIPVALNLTGDLYKEGDNLKEILVKQAKSAIHFEACVKTMIGEGFGSFIEIGPGNVLAGFVKKTAKAMGKEVEVVSIDSKEDLDKVIEIYKKG